MTSVYESYLHAAHAFLLGFMVTGMKKCQNYKHLDAIMSRVRSYPYCQK